MLSDLGSADPLTCVAVVAMLGIVTCLASYLPARTCHSRSIRWLLSAQTELSSLGKAVAPSYGRMSRLLWTLHMSNTMLICNVQRIDCAVKVDSRGWRRRMDRKTSEVLQGTLDLMILKTLHALGPLHGFGIARRLEQVSRDVLQLNEGTVYTALLRLQQQGWITAEWGTSENNRKAKFYSITRRGRKQLEVETENWKRISDVVGRVLRLEQEGG